MKPLSRKSMLSYYGSLPKHPKPRQRPRRSTAYAQYLKLTSFPQTEEQNVPARPAESSCLSPPQDGQAQTPPPPTFSGGDRIIIKFLNRGATATGGRQYTLTGTEYLIKDDNGSLIWCRPQELEKTTIEQTPYPQHWYGHNGQRYYWTWKWDKETGQLISIDLPEGTPTMAQQNEVKKMLQDGRLKTPPSWYKEPKENGWPSQYILELNAPYEETPSAKRMEESLKPKDNDRQQGTRDGPRQEVRRKDGRTLRELPKGRRGQGRQHHHLRKKGSSGQGQGMPEVLFQP